MHLTDRSPAVPPESLVAGLVPPPRFADARFSHLPAGPGAAHPGRGGAGARGVRDHARAAAAPAVRPGEAGRSGRASTSTAATAWARPTCWPRCGTRRPAPKAYGTFVELTHLVGALGFGGTVDALSGHRLLAIDEFELDDPGDTVLVSTLLGRLVEAGTKVAATSNTLPGALGEGRFATQDFLREIQGLSARFAPVRVDGEDYRHRGLPAAPDPVERRRARAGRRGHAGGDRTTASTTCSPTSPTLHPSRYGALVEGVALVCLARRAPGRGPERRAAPGGARRPALRPRRARC